MREPWLSVSTARLAQSAERKALNLVVVGSSPTVGVLFLVGLLLSLVNSDQGIILTNCKFTNLKNC